VQLKVNSATSVSKVEEKLGLRQSKIAGAELRSSATPCRFNAVGTTARCIEFPRPQRGVARALSQGVRIRRSDPDACPLAPLRGGLSDVADLLRQREGGACGVELQKGNVGGIRSGEPSQSAQLHDVLRRFGGHDVAICTPQKKRSRFGCICCGIAA
jgi:hypothetical protein